MNEEGVSIPGCKRGTGRAGRHLSHGAWLGADETAMVALDFAAGRQQVALGSSPQTDDILTCLLPATPEPEHPKTASGPRPP